MTGVVQKLMMDKGFGFIRPDGGQRSDVFFHRSGFVDPGEFDTLKEGDRVEFEEGLSNKGPRAEQLSRVV